MKPDRPVRWVDAASWLFLLVLLTAAFHPQMVSAAARVVTGADKGGQVHLKAGETIELRLKSNPSTGYMWYVHPKSTPLLKLVRELETEPTKPGVGRPIFQVFTFEARRAGEGVLLLHYARSWDKLAPDEEQFNLRVSIE